MFTFNAIRPFPAKITEQRQQKRESRHFSRFMPLLAIPFVIASCKPISPQLTSGAQSGAQGHAQGANARAEKSVLFFSHAANSYALPLEQGEMVGGVQVLGASTLVQTNKATFHISQANVQFE